MTHSEIADLQSVKMVLESQERMDHAAGVVLRMLKHMDENNDGHISYNEFMVRGCGIAYSKGGTCDDTVRTIRRSTPPGPTMLWTLWGRFSG